jgi:tetratricopeptide (TPR) repeat protein
VFIGSLTSNLKDHHPFESVRLDNHPPADEVYARAHAVLAAGNTVEALELFTYAKDLDALRFRAPTAFNDVIHELTESTGNMYVPVNETFLKNSEDGIIGFNLMLEHLHPNRRGYFLMGTAYFEALRDADFLGRRADLSRLQPYETYFERMHMSEFDERVAWHRVQTLTNSWPFVSQPDPMGYPRGYRLRGLADSLAFQVVNSPLRWDEAKVFYGERLRLEGRHDEALAEYFGLIRDQPANDSPYVFAARIYLSRNDFISARPLLESALNLEESAYVTKMLGAIEVDAGNLDRGINLLERSLKLAPDDPQALFNLSGAYGLKGRHADALELARRVEQINPNFPDLRSWIAQLQFAMNR